MKIFLDIDGVMVHADSTKSLIIWADGFYHFSDEAVETLNNLLNGDDEIIISSTHRFRYSNEEWNVMFNSRGIRHKVSIMNSTTTGDVHSEKLEDILLYIDHFKLKPEELIIIDDDKRLNNLPDQWKERLILTNSYTGLTKEDGKIF